MLPADNTTYSRVKHRSSLKSWDKLHPSGPESFPQDKRLEFSRDITQTVQKCSTHPSDQELICILNQRRGMTEAKPTRTTSTPAPQYEPASRPEQSTLDTIQDTVKTAVDSLVEALSRQALSHGYKLPAVQVPKFKASTDWRLFKAKFKQTMII